jgi:hypothetical protein
MRTFDPFKNKNKNRTLCLVVEVGREREKGTEEGKRKLFLFGVHGCKKEKNILSFFCLVCKGTKKKKCMILPLCTCVYDIFHSKILYLKVRV